MDKLEVESGSVGEMLVISLRAVVAIQRRGDEYTIHTTGGPISVSEDVAEKVRLAWDKLPQR